MFKADVASDGDLLFGEMAASPLESQLLSDYWGGRSTKFFSAGKSWWLSSAIVESSTARLECRICRSQHRQALSLLSWFMFQQSGLL